MGGQASKVLLKPASGHKLSLCVIKDKKESDLGFGSDNHSGVHPNVLKAMEKVNSGHVSAYGADPMTLQVVEQFKSIFGPQAQPHLVLTGTGANVLSIKTVCQSYQGIIATDIAHMNSDECGAPEYFTGSKILTVPHVQGKLTPESIKVHLNGSKDQHWVQPKLISVTQSTEFGTVYTQDELKALRKVADEHDLYIHMDGARISNAAVSLGCDLRALTTDCGIDILSFGGTKNGLMMGEAVIILNPEIGEGFAWFRKQAMQLSSKMRYVAAQFDALLHDDLWRHNAINANNMAKYLGDEAAKLPGVELLFEVQANEVFARVPQIVIDELATPWKFYIWDPDHSLVRWVTSWDTEKSEIDEFISSMKNCLG